MITRTVTVEDLARLKREREEADRRYNEALANLDAAVLRVPDMPHPPPAPDETQITPLNERWRVVVPPPARGGWRGRLAGFVWQIVGPIAERQETFNSLLVDHLNRNVPVGRQGPVSAAATIERLRLELERLASFQSLLMAFLQEVTPYADTKDREFSGLARRVHEDNAEMIDLLDNRTVGLAGAISGVGDELLKRWESMVAREARFEARAASLTSAHDALRTSVAAAHQATQTLKREMSRLAEHGRPAAATDVASAPAPRDDRVAAGAAAASSPLLASAFDSYKYVGFEHQFRGSTDEIRQRLTDYLPVFAGATDVLDVGCGRGEFLELLSTAGVTARGLDVNHEMVEVCRERGLRADEGDAVDYLRALEDGSLGGVFCAQVVEHLRPDYLLTFVELAFHKLRPGGKLVIETINPMCWFAFFQSYLRDLTHVQPVHPETLSYYLSATGFARVSIQFRAPYPEHEKLQRVAGADAEAETFNHNVDKLNSLLFTHMDYAAIAERL
ncbi:MAG: methyltransferase domain-containing protein [Vicinamibacterales bacterium]